MKKPHALHRVYDLPDLRPINNPRVTFDVRIEIFKAGRTYYPKVWFLEIYRLQPTFPMTRKGRLIAKPSDFELWTLQMSLFAKDILATSAKAVLAQVLRELGALLEDA